MIFDEFGITLTCGTRPQLCSVTSRDSDYYGIAIPDGLPGLAVTSVVKRSEEEAVREETEGSLLAAPRRRSDRCACGV